MDVEKSTFIKVDKFETIMSTLSIIKKRLADSKETLSRINELKQEEDITMQKWESDLDSVQTKLDSIEMELFTEE